ncbi:MAG: hypothetical protein U9N12_00915 [Euryarchaeota archaeon]|nr:hypothetical protein [Euryarchaeota archaeon]
MKTDTDNTQQHRAIRNSTPGALHRVCVLTMVLLCTASFVCGTAAGEASIYVNQTGWWNAVGDTTFHKTNPGQIQAAIASASTSATAGNTIFVYNGSYSENVEVSESLTLRGEGADVVTVTAADSGDHVFFERQAR